jgi:hypothetical protein
MWYLPDAVDALAEPTPVRLRSVHSKQASVIRFSNKSARAVRALWVDFDGHEVRWGHGRQWCHAWGCFVHGRQAQLRRGPPLRPCMQHVRRARCMRSCCSGQAVPLRGMADT